MHGRFHPGPAGIGRQLLQSGETFEDVATILAETASADVDAIKKKLEDAGAKVAVK